MQRHRRLGICAIAAILLLAWFTVREVRDTRARNRASTVVAGLGGRMGSLPFWPIGDEIRVEFHGTKFSPAELDRLAVLKPLTDRHRLAVMFEDTNVTRSDVLELRRALPDALIFRIEDGIRTDDR